MVFFWCKLFLKLCFHPQVHSIFTHNNLNTYKNININEKYDLNRN